MGGTITLAHGGHYVVLDAVVGEVVLELNAPPEKSTTVILAPGPYNVVKVLSNHEGLCAKLTVCSQNYTLRERDFSAPYRLASPFHFKGDTSAPTPEPLEGKTSPFLMWQRAGSINPSPQRLWRQ